MNTCAVAHGVICSKMQLSKERQAAEAAVVESVKAETTKALDRAQQVKQMKKSGEVSKHGEKGRE